MFYTGGGGIPPGLLVRKKRQGPVRVKLRSLFNKNMLSSLLQDLLDPVLPNGPEAVPSRQAAVRDEDC